MVCFDAFVRFVDVYALWMCMLAFHYGRCPKNTRDLSVASISRLPDLLLSFWRFAECLGRFRRCHEVDPNLVLITAVKVSRNMHSIFLQISSHLTVWAWNFRCTDATTSESYVISKWSKITNPSLFRKVWVLYVSIWLISTWDFTYSPKLEKQIHACSTDLSGSFSWKRKAHASC